MDVITLWIGSDKWWIGEDKERNEATSHKESPVKTKEDECIWIYGM